MEIFEGDIGSRVSRLEVINTGRRRRFTEDEKLRIVAESFAGRGLVRIPGIHRTVFRSKTGRHSDMKPDAIPINNRTV